jgi:hypothetical protein
MHSVLYELIHLEAQPIEIILMMQGSGKRLLVLLGFLFPLVEELSHRSPFTHDQQSNQAVISPDTGPTGQVPEKQQLLEDGQPNGQANPLYPTAFWLR